MKREPISVVIPSYNAQKLLEKNIPKIVATMISLDQLIIIDDASTDTTLEWLQENCILEQVSFSNDAFFIPDTYHTTFDKIKGTLYQGKVKAAGKIISLTVFKNAENVRFGAAANIGFLLAQNPLVFLCNNDVIPFPDTLTSLARHFINETVFGVGCLEYEGSKECEKISGRNVLWFERGLFQHSKAPTMDSGETAWVSGGSGLFSVSKWREIGGFDPLFYPAYWEDIDVSYQAHARGWKVLFDADATVIHEHETTNGTVFGNAKIRQMSWRNAFKFTWKNGTIVQKIQFVLWLPYWLFHSFTDLVAT
jgi:GT2 family glycosyltransferase